MRCERLAAKITPAASAWLGICCRLRGHVLCVSGYHELYSGHKLCEAMKLTVVGADGALQRSVCALLTGLGSMSQQEDLPLE